MKDGSMSTVITITFEQLILYLVQTLKQLVYDSWQEAEMQR